VHAKCFSFAGINSVDAYRKIFRIIEEKEKKRMK
jgi:hypothetical protein